MEIFNSIQVAQEQPGSKSQRRAAAGGKAPQRGVWTSRLPYARDSYPDDTNLRRKPLWHDRAFSFVPIYEQKQEEEKEEMRTNRKRVRDHKDLHVIQSQMRRKSEAKQFKYIPVYQEHENKTETECPEASGKTVKDHKDLHRIEIQQRSPITLSSSSSSTSSEEEEGEDDDDLSF